MSKLSDNMKVFLLASTVAATNVYADDKLCPDVENPGIFDGRKVSNCINDEFIKLSNVEGESENYRVVGAHEINVFSKRSGGHMGTIDVHWDTLQPETSEAEIPFSALTMKAQQNFKDAVKEACAGINDNLAKRAQPVLDRAEEYYGEFPATDLRRGKGRIDALKQFTTEYCADY